MSARIRHATPEDAQAIHEIYAPVVLNTPISFELTLPDIAELAERVRSTQERFPWLVCELEHGVAGYAYASSHRARAAYQWTVETAIYVHSRARRRGVGRGLYAALLAILRLQGFVNAYAGITLPNPASVALHEAVGFKPMCVYRRVGFKLGAWHDVGWWQQALNDYAPDPAPPVPIATVRDLPAAVEALRRGAALVRA